MTNKQQPNDEISEAPAAELPIVQKNIVGLIREHQPTTWVPPGETIESIRASLSTMSVNGSSVGELSAYAEEDCERFLHTVAMVPEGTGTLLEIGANPYFTSVLLEEHRPGYACARTNYFTGDVLDIRQSVRLQLPDGTNYTAEFDSKSVNVESETFPWPNESFDIVLYCEVIEHLLTDPAHSITEIWRLLKPGGQLILTTPNVARLENVARMVAGANLYDPYSGFGPYGRHNREFTRHELWKLLSFLGFEANYMFTADVNQNRAANYLDLSKIAHLVEFRAGDLGQYIFSRWTKTEKAPSTKRPSWLYRSLPADTLETVDL